MRIKRALLIVGIMGVFTTIAMVVYWRYFVTERVTIVDGFVPFSSFRLSDAPGTVVRIDRSGGHHRVIQLKPKIETTPEVTYDLESSLSFSVEKLIQATLPESNCRPLSGQYNPSLVSQVTINSINGIREFTFDEDVDPLLNELNRMFAEGKLRYRPTESYWIIRETIKTDNVNYSANIGWLTRANVMTSLRSCNDDEPIETSEGHVELNFEASNQVNLKKVFDEPLRGWYRAEQLEIYVPFGASPGTVPTVKLLNSDDTSPPPISSWPRL